MKVLDLQSVAEFQAHVMLLKEQAEKLRASLKEFQELLSPQGMMARQVMLARLNCAAVLGALNLDVIEPEPKKTACYELPLDRKMRAANDDTFRD